METRNMRSSDSREGSNLRDGGQFHFITPTIGSIKRKDILTLAQAWNPLNEQNISTYWLNSNDLGLEGILASEWDMFRRTLIDSGVILQEGIDQVLWTGGDSQEFHRQETFI
jgi:hypothetical protein